MEIEEIISELQLGNEDTVGDFVEYFHNTIRARLLGIRTRLDPTLFSNEEEELRSSAYLRLVIIARQIMGGEIRKLDSLESYVNCCLFFDFCACISSSLSQGMQNPNQVKYHRFVLEGDAPMPVSVSQQQVVLACDLEPGYREYEIRHDLYVLTETEEHRYLLVLMESGMAIKDIATLLGMEQWVVYRWKYKLLNAYDEVA